jgi:BirA family transcriptional regulator, biotin operon repressor / biotin---[acetyl-CoA-carboxylase] ligase
MDFIVSNQIRLSSFIRHVEIHGSLDSTNDRAAKLVCDANIELPALIVARHQTAGRGRGRNAWWSSNGALTFSVVLEPVQLGIATMNWPQLSLATAVAVCDALQPEVPAANCAIKWPNDVLINGRKVAGILIESPGGAAPGKNRLIIGIGLNVNNSMRTAPNDVRAVATALCDETQRVHELQIVLNNVLGALERRLNQLAENNPCLSRDWQNSAWMPVDNIAAACHHRTISGRFGGFAEDGALLIETAAGVERVYSATVRPLTH